MTYCRCGAFIYPTNCSELNPCTTVPTSSSTIVYVGPNLTIAGINNGDTLTVALQKIDEYFRVNTTTTTTTTVISPTFVMVFDDIVNASYMIDGDAANVDDWNIFFNLPTNGNPFISVITTNTTVELFGGSNIHIADYLFTNSYVVALLNISSSIVISVGRESFSFEYGTTCINLITVDFQNATSIDINCFGNCSSLITVNLPNVITLGNSCFQNCSSLTSLNIPLCENLGSSIGDDSIFYNMLGVNITLTIPTALMTCNTGAPDGDIQYLQANNTVTIIEVV